MNALLKILLLRIVLIGLLFCFPAKANAKELNSSPSLFDEVQCKNVENLTADIYSCDENIEAELEANRCKLKVIEKWNSSFAELKIEFQKYAHFQETKQNSQYANTNIDFETAIKKLRKLIDLTETQRDLIDSYPESMLNDPSADDLESSPSCYKDHYIAISNEVEDLERKIMEGKKVLRKAEALNAAVISSVEKIQNTSGSGFIHGSETFVGGEKVGKKINLSGVSESPKDQSTKLNTEKTYKNIGANANPFKEPFSILNRGDYGNVGNNKGASGKIVEEGVNGLWVDRLIDTYKIENK